MSSTSKKETSTGTKVNPIQAVSSVPISTVWKVLTVVSVCWVLAQSSSIIHYQREARKHHFPVNDLSDLWIMVVALVCIATFRLTLTKIISERIRRRQLLVDPSSSEIKIDRSIRAVVSVVWYTFSCVDSQLNPDLRAYRAFRSSLSA